MAILKKHSTGRTTIDLTGPDGNAFVLLGTASKWSRELGLDTESILMEMRSGDYENLIEVFDREFGSFCDLLR